MALHTPARGARPRRRQQEARALVECAGIIWRFTRLNSTRAAHDEKARSPASRPHSRREGTSALNGPPRHRIAKIWLFHRRAHGAARTVKWDGLPLDYRGAFRYLRMSTRGYRTFITASDKWIYRRRVSSCSARSARRYIYVYIETLHAEQVR